MARKTVVENHAIVTDEEAYQANLDKQENASQSDKGSEETGAAESVAIMSAAGAAPASGETNPPEGANLPEETGNEDGGDGGDTAPDNEKVTVAFIGGASFRIRDLHFIKGEPQEVAAEIALRLLKSGMFKEV